MNDQLLRCKGILTRISLFFIGFLLAISGWAQTGESTVSIFNVAGERQDDFAPGEFVIFKGTGWTAGETVTLTFEETPIPESCLKSHDISLIVDSAGNFSNYDSNFNYDPNGEIPNTQFLVKPNHLGVTFDVLAEGLQSGYTATTVFTDGRAEISNVTPTQILSTSDVVTITAANNGAGNIQNYFIHIRQGTLAGPIVYRDDFSLAQAPSSSNPRISYTNRTWDVKSNQAPNGGEFVPNGLYYIIAGASNSETVTQGLYKTVNVNINSAPVLSLATAPASIDELVLFTLQASATDADLPANTLTFSLTTAPTGASIDATTGLISWTPTEAQGDGSSYDFTVQVSDGALTDTESFLVTVNEVNVAPVLSLATAPASIDELVLFTLQASATDADLPANTLTFSLTTAPTGASIDATTGLISWTPTEAQGDGSSYDFTVQVSDGALTDIESFLVTVNEVNVAPVLSLATAPASIDELVLFTLQASATDADLPANTLTFSLTTAPTGASIDATTGLISWTPTEAQGDGSSYDFTVQVSDGALTDTESFLVTVNEVNVAPVLSLATAPASIDELVLFTLQASATDADLPANTLTFSLTTAPTGASIDATTGLISWTPTEAQGDGSSYDFTVQVSDGALTDTESFLVTVNEVNVAPVLSLATAPASIDELVLFTLQASATDADLPANTLTFSLTTAPTGASIDATTGLISWTPTEAQGDGSSYDFTVQVSDGALTDTESFLVTVNEVNVAPVLSLATAPASIDELVLFTLQASATDADLPANTLTFSLTTAPTGASIDATTGLISWTPTEAQGDGSSYDFTVQVSDGALTDTESFLVTVNEVNVAPVLSLATAPASIDELVLFTLQASATDADLPANTLTFSLTTAPTGASIDATTGLISWTPTEAQGDGSSYDFTVQVSDGALTDTESFLVTVNEVNVAPVLSLATAPASIDELVLFTLQASATDADLPANTLTFSLTTAPTGASIDATTGLISWTPTEAQGDGSSYDFTVQVSDGALTDTESFLVTVNEVNVAPVLSLATAPASIDELVLFTLQASATDADLPANTLTFSLTTAPTGASIDATTGLISWTPTEAQGDGSSYDFTVQVSDGALTDTESFLVTVNEVNVAPVLSLATAPASIDELVLFTLQASATDADLPANTLTFSLTTAPTGASIDATTGLISWTPTEAQGDGSSYDFTVQVSDGALTDTESFLVTVNEVNVAPVLSLATAPASIDELVLFTLQASATDADLPANTLTFSLTTAPTGASIDATTGLISWTPTEAQGDGSSYDFTVQVSDGALTDTESFLVTVNEVNVAPVLSLATAPASIDELVLFTLQASATDADLPANTLTFSLTTAPTGASIDATTGLISWTPTEAQGDGSSYDFTVQVSDGALTDTESFLVTVNEVNVAPVLSLATAPASIDELVLFTLQASATDADLPANTLTFSLTTAPTGASIDATTGLISWTPTEAQGDGSSYDFTVQVSDGALTDTESFLVTVNEVNVAPVLSLATAPASIDELVLFTLQASATDADLPANTLTFSLTTAPTGASIDATTGLISWTPTEAQGDGSSYDFTVQVSDGALTDTESFLVTVNEVNVAPVLSLATAPASIDELVLFTLQASATDADLPANTLTFSLTTAPTGASIDATTGLISWTPTEAQGDGSSYDFTVQVSDGALTDTESFLVTVNEVNVAPVLSLATAPASIDELVLFTLQASATDADLPANTLTFSLTTAPTGASIDATTGLISWTPTEAQGDGSSYDFTVQVSDGALTDTESFLVTVNEVNVAPVLSLATAPASIDELVLFTLQASATDADLPANTLTFSLTTAPTGASIDATTGLISWTPTEAQGDGSSYDFTVQVSDGALTDTESFLVTVNEVNVAPVLSLATAPASIDELVLFTLQASATDADLPANTLTFSLTTAPTGASIDATTGLISWTPTEAQGDGSSYDFTVQVSDGALTDTESFLVTVNEVNVAPVLSLATAPASIDELVLFTLQASATDADLPANTLTFSLTTAPTGASIDATTGLISWTPTEAQGDGSSYDFTVQVSDGALTDTESFLVTVNEVNVAPVLSLATAPASIDELVLFTLQASATDADLPANTLTFSLTTAPTGASIDATTGLISWTPTEAQGDGSSYDFTVQVSDGALTDTESFLVTVNEVNVAPVLSLATAPASIDELVLFTLQASATDADLPANTLTFSLTTAPTGASIDATTGLISWTPTEAQGDGSSYDFTVQVSDGALTDTESFLVTVNEVNVAPVLSLATAPASIDELVLFTLQASATDADLPANTLTFSLTTAPTGASIDATTGLISWTPTEAQGDGSSYDFTVQVSDGALTDTESFLVTVNEVNVAPVLSLATAPASIDELVLFTLQASATDADLPANTLTFSLTTAPTGASIDATTGLISWTPTEAQGDGSSYDFTVQVSDGALTDTESFLVTVNEVNVAPVLSLATAPASIDELVLFTLQASATDADLPANTLTFSLTTAPTGASIDATTGLISWTPTEAQGDGSSYDFTVQVSDGALTDTESFLVTVNEVNVAPVLSLATAPASIDELVLFTLQASATDADLPANTLTFSLTTAPTGASIDATTGLISWTPTEAQGDGSSYDFTVQVSDGALTDTESFLVTVNEVNVAPVLSLATAPASIDELVLFTLQASATDADLPANTLTFSLTTAPTGASIDATTGLISWTPTEAQGDGSSYDFTVQVSDGALTDTESFLVTVNEVNVAPVSTSPIVVKIGEAVQTGPILIGSTITAYASFTDTDLPNEVHTIQWLWGDGSVDTYNLNSGSVQHNISKTHTYNNAGVYRLTLVVTDSNGESFTIDYDYVVIYDANGGFVTGGGWIDSPAIAMSSGVTGKANFGFNAKYKNGKNNMNEVDGNTNFQFKAGDLHFSSIKHNDMELVISGRKATYTGTGTVNGTGDHKFRVVAIDGDFQNGTGPDKFRIKIWQNGSDSQILYDNQRGMSEAGEDATVLGGGSIVIHKPKGNSKAQEDITKGTPITMEDLRPEILETLAASPNPVVSYSTVRFSVKENAIATLRLYDNSGRLVETLFTGAVKAFENYDVDLQRRNLMSGIYIVKLTTAKGHSYDKRIIIN